jgi:aquaporin rerated protein, other eukaryote
MSSSKPNPPNNLGLTQGEAEHDGTAIRHYHPHPGTTRQSSSRHTLLGFLSPAVRNHTVAALAEFTGTFLFLLLAFGATQAVNNVPEDAYPDDNDNNNNNHPHHHQPVTDLGADPARLLFISVAFGASLAVHAWVFFRISGGQLNPAVSLALAARGAVSWPRAAVVVPAQLLGGVAAAGVVAALLPGPLRVATRLGAGVSVAQGLFVEGLLTALLVLAVLMLAVEKHRATCVAPLGIGLGLFMGQMM